MQGVIRSLCHHIAFVAVVVLLLLVQVVVVAATTTTKDEGDGGNTDSKKDMSTAAAAVPDLQMHPKVYCTRNEKECPEQQNCLSYKPYMCLEGPKCGPWCYSVECETNDCPGEQLCVKLRYLDDMDTPVDRCYCPSHLVPSANGSCVAADSKCEAALKDRYCDFGCQLDSNSSVVCSCPTGFSLQTQSGKFGDYVSCEPSDADFDTLKLILNGVDSEEWQLSEDNFVTLNTPTAIDRLQLRPNIKKHEQIYAVTKDVNGQYQLSLFSTSGQRLTDAYHILYSMDIQDFCMDWPSSNVYYISTSEPRLVVCTLHGTACRILAAAALLDDPKEIVIDSTLQFLFVADTGAIWKISLDGLKSSKIDLPSAARKLTLDYENNYLHYLLIQDYSVYRIYYNTFHRHIAPQKIMWLHNTQDVGEITAMASVGRKLYISEYKAMYNISYLYAINSTNSFLSPSLSLVHQGPGRLSNILAYHPTLFRLGPATKLANGNCDLQLQDQCVCMEGSELSGANGSCVPVDLKSTEKDVLLYTSPSKRLVQAIFVSDSLTCPKAGFAHIPINPITLPDYVNNGTDVHLGYDPVDNMIYISEQVVIRKASAAGTGYVDRLIDTGWRARGGTIVYGLAINPSLRTLFYAEYSRIHYYVIAVSLDQPQVRNIYVSSPSVGQRYFSTTRVGSSYQFQILPLRHYQPMIIVQGDSMLHSRSIDPKSGLFYDIGFGSRNTVGYSYLGPAANSTSERTEVNIGLEFNGLSMGGGSILHFVSHHGQYGMVNTSNNSQYLLCANFTLGSVMYIRPNAQLSPRPSACTNCSSVCIQGSAANFTCACEGPDPDGDCRFDVAKCEGDQVVCPNTTMCLDRSKLCDGVDDCTGKEDEKFYTYCPLSDDVCGDSYVRCNESHSVLECIPEEFMCDGAAQCPNGEDERHCEKNCLIFSCPVSGVCYGLSLCDGVSDCPEFSSEQDICSKCQSDAFKCPTTYSCVPNVNLCDGVRDCPDASDEANCTTSAAGSHCEVDEMVCGSGQCIPEIWWCDGVHDCVDQSDEQSCETTTCGAEFIKCNNTGQCIPPSWLCDKHEDCTDGEDELNCTYSCPKSQYYCPNSAADVCISKTRLCDDIADCSAGEDETVHCGTQACDSSPCSHQCVVDPETGAPICLCPQGMELANKSHCVEIRRKCGQWGVCSQQCVSLLDDEFKCTCHDGYEIQPDKYTCKHTERPVSLIFSNRHDLRLLPAEPGTHYSVLISNLRNTIAVDYHFEQQYVFWSDVIADKIYRGTRDPSSDSMSLKDITVVVTNGLPTAEGLAVDWIGNHIYWVESGLDVIEVADLDGNNRTTIISHSEINPMENPRSIAVDPRVGLLFWADWGIKQIRRASMAGKDPQMLFWVNNPKYIPDGGWANGLTLDYDMSRVYWNDAKSDSIQTVKYDGSGFHMVLSKNDMLMHSFAISVFENWVYWSDWRKNSINRANKWNGTDVQVVQNTVTQPFDLKVFHKGRQPSAAAADACAESNGQCSHLCLRDGDTVLCSCPHLMQLGPDAKTCQDRSSFLLLASSTMLTSLSLSNDSSYGVMPTLSAPLIDSVYMVDYYMVVGQQQRLFWGDSGSGTIATADVDGSNPTSIIDLSVAVEYALAVDYVYKRLYISTYTLRGSFGAIDVCAFNGSRRSTITTGLIRPTQIALQPSNGTMFVVDEGHAAIYRMYMNGSHMSDDLTPYNILDHSSLNIRTVQDMRVVLSSDNHMQSQLYFGNRTHIFRYDGKTINLVTSGRVESWTVHDNDLYFTSKFVNQSLPAGFDVKKMSVLELSKPAVKVGAMKGSLPQQIKLVQTLAAVSEEDKVECNNCNHHCLPPSNTETGNATCICYTGYRLESDGCKAIPAMLLYASNTNQRRLGALELIADGSAASAANVLPKIQLVNRPNSVQYYSSCSQPEPDYIYWIDGGRSITRSSRDMTERQTILSGLIAAKDLTLDPQGGNLYWIDSFTGTVQVCKTDGSHNLILAQVDKNNDNKLMSIALHPSKGYLYYLESVHGISRITLGNDRKVEPIKSSPLAGALAMAVDVVDERLFVCDGLHQILSMALDGSHLSNVYSIDLDNQNCSALAVHNDIVYYSISRGFIGEIFMVNVSASPVSVSLANITGNNNDISLARLDTCSYLGPNPCSTDNGGCEALCLFNGNTSSDSHCVCAMGVLDENKKNCTDLQDFVVYSKVDAIEYHSVEVTDAPLIPPYPRYSSNLTKNVIALATDADRQRIYYSDIQRRALSWASYDGKSFDDILLNVDSVEGIAYADDVLYFTYQSYSGGNKPAIKKVDLSAAVLEAKDVLELTTSDAPRAIAIHSCSGLLFWTNWNEAKPSIQRVETSGNFFTSIVTENIAIPNGLAIDHKMEKLFWADANLDKIEMCDFLGSECVIVLEDVSPHIFAMAIHGDYLYWTDWMQRAVKMAHKIYGLFNQTVVAKLPRQPMGIAIASHTSCEASPCHNVECQQTCSVIGNGKGYACGCFNGYVPDPAKVGTCKPVQGCLESAAFACAGDCIPWELTCDGINHCPAPDGSSINADEDPLFCAKRKCPEDKYYNCANQRCIPLSARCNGYDDCGDISDEFDCKDVCDATSHFECDDGQCIPRTDLCDGVPHCWDITDELPPNCNSTHTGFVDCSAFNNPFYGHFKNGTKCPNTPVCIIDEWKCDGHNDCWDNSDEVDCDKPKNCAGEDEWECRGLDSQVNNMKQCIIKAWRCDGDMDCNDESDEEGCDSITCPEGDFTCDNSILCIPLMWKCDGKRDCADGSDELNCPVTEVPTCRPSQFPCADQSACVDVSFLCDGEQDCLDGSDESPVTGCIPKECSPGEFSCANGRCIPLSFLCDRTNDCMDESDEPSTCSYETCDLSTQFMCKDKSCIDLSLHCNLWPDCPDGSDELPETCPKPANSSCAKGEWKCSQGNCIDESKLCDGHFDCGFDDELACNINECMEMNGGCNQICVDEPIEFHCGCHIGYKLQPDDRTCIDIDECEVDNPCSHRCLNTPGRYLCSCSPGYSLRMDKSSCRPMRGAPAYLLVANRYYIRNISLQIDSRTNESTQLLLSRNMTNAVGLDYDWRDQMVYWTDVTNDEHNISRMFMNGTGKEIIHSVALKHPDGLAVDWIARNLYWSDNVLNTIQVSKLDGNYSKVLLYDITEPRSLQLLPAKGYLFYTDWGQGAHIGRVGMDGSAHTHIITEGIGWPNALTIDPHAEKLFFGDAKLDYIAMTDLDGNNKKIILNHGVDHIFSLAVFDNSLYWSDWGDKQIRRVHKYTGQHMDTLTTLIHRPMEIQIVHELNQVYKGVNPCDALNCSKLCLLQPKEGTSSLQAVCACPEYFYLHTDHRTCLSNCSHLSKFQCTSDTQCLHFTQICDGHPDCVDGSDEKDCGDEVSPCDPFQFNCNSISPDSTPECVDAVKLCDGEIQCSNGEDEKIFGMCQHYSCLSDLYYHCYNTTNYLCVTSKQICQEKSIYTCSPPFDISFCDKGGCAKTEFECNDTGKCIPYVYHCDGDDDCDDGSDEANETCTANVECLSNYVRCNQSGQCIPESWMCDGEKDCNNGQDEDPSHCEDSTCPVGYYQCDDKKCIPNRWLCDYDSDCGDGADELNCQMRNCSESEIACARDSRCIHSSKKCDRYIDCSDGSDEMGCPYNNSCSGDYFRCEQAGQCIPRAWRCDGTPDCLHFTDEIGCSDRQCRANEFQCANSLCISAAFICDGQNDCLDESDERDDLCEHNQCLPNRFRCANSRCVPVAMLCDGNDDCHDMSDENDKNCVAGCGDGYYRCPSGGGCIAADKVCDGNVDCPSITSAVLQGCANEGCPVENDERNSECVVRRAVGGCNNVHASMYFIRALQKGRYVDKLCTEKIKCVDMPPFQVNITCEKGYEVDVRHALDHCNVCKDKDECLEYGSCAQLCANKEGDYSCDCQPGFVQTVSNHPGLSHDCVLDTDEVPQLLLADGQAIRTYDMARQSNDRPSFISHTNLTSRIDSITVDLAGDMWYAYMISYHSKSILKADITSLKQDYLKASGLSKRESSTALKPQSMSQFQVIWPNLGDPKSLTYDWVHGNLYWVDASAATISLLEVKRRLQATIVTPQSMLSALNDRHLNPQYITIDPVTSLKIFWTDCCVKPRIWSADLDGSSPAMLTDKLEWPAGIVCDVVNQRLYWTDSKRRTVSTMAIGGKDITIVHMFSDMSPSRIDVFGRELIVASFNRSKVVTLDKFRGLPRSTHNNSLSTIVNSEAVHVGDICIIHSTKYTRPKKEPVCRCGSNAISLEEGIHEKLRRCACLCADDYIKINETDCQYCPCKNNGTCSNQPHEPVKCVCPAGFGGQLCELNLCAGYCSSGAQCNVFNGKPYCLCPAHLAGDRCEMSKCKSFLCKNKGTCHVDNGGLPYCMCPPAFTGATCKQKIDGMCKTRCGSRAARCHADAVTNDYNCTCWSNYTGADCHTCVLDNGSRLYGCHGRGVCSFTDAGQPKCSCTVGHFDPSTQCLDSICKGHCLNGGTCRVTGGQDTVCTCPAYFTGDRCELRLTCVTGYCRNGGTCFDSDTPTMEPAKCLCTKGYAGPTCESSCQPSCFGPKTCQLVSLKPTCVCPNGLQGENCQYTTQCNSRCNSHGVCLGCLPAQSLNCDSCCNCSCNEGWSGETCQTSNVGATKPTKSVHTGTIAGIVCGLVAVLLLLFIIIYITCKKQRRRRLMFEHLRLSDEREDTVHVSNPMYMKSLQDAEDLDEPDDDDFSVYSATNTSNFANPLYSGRKASTKGEERTLLINNRDDDQ